MLKSVDIFFNLSISNLFTLDFRLAKSTPVAIFKLDFVGYNKGSYGLGEY